MTTFNDVRCITHSASSVVEQYLLLFWAHQAERITRLFVVFGIILSEVPPVSVAVDFQWRFAELRLLLPLVKAVGLVVGEAAIVTIHSASPIADRKSVVSGE